MICDAATLTSTYGKFIAEPFERGFGTTVGNGLRRILLSSLEGSAITQIKVHNAQHEFTTIKGVLEDVTDIVLNVKSLVVKNHSDSTQGAAGREEHRRRDHRRRHRNRRIGRDASTRITLIATLTDDVPFVVEMVVENGRGYVPSTEHSQNIQEIGIIPIDAVYQPGRPRALRHRGNSRRSEDELRQADARDLDRRLGRARRWRWSKSAKILRKHLTPFVQYTRARPAGPLAGPRHGRRHRRGHGSEAEHEPRRVERSRCGPAIAWNRKTS